MPKYNKKITIGDVILLNIIPNLNQIKFGFINIFLKKKELVSKNNEIK